MARRRAIAVVASAPNHCGVCKGRREVQVRALPVGAWVTTSCPHCLPRVGVPIFPLPVYQDTPRGTPA